MAKLFANSRDPDQMPHFALFASYPFEGLQTKMGKNSVHLSLPVDFNPCHAE